MVINKNVKNTQNNTDYTYSLLCRKKLIRVNDFSCKGCFSKGTSGYATREACMRYNLDNKGD